MLPAKLHTVPTPAADLSLSPVPEHSEVSYSNALQLSYDLKEIQEIILQCLTKLKGLFSLSIHLLIRTVSKLKVYDKKNCTMVFMINISSHMYGEMILGVFEIFCRGISKKFNLKVHKLQDTFLGTWTRATCVLKMSRGSP